MPTPWIQSLIITLPKKATYSAARTTELSALSVTRANGLSEGEIDAILCHFHILYACESWTLTAELEKRTQATEMRFCRRLLNISYKDHVENMTNSFLTLIKKWKLRWFGHLSRSSGLAKTILHGTVNGKRREDRQKKKRVDTIKEWTGIDFAISTRAAENRTRWKGVRWKGVDVKSSVVPQRPSKVMG